MTPALLTFYAAAAVALLAALAALVGRDPARATRALALALLAVMVVEALLAAPLVALISGIAIAAALAIVGAVANLAAADTRHRPDDRAPPSRSPADPDAASTRPLAGFIASLTRRRSSASTRADPDPASTRAGPADPRFAGPAGTRAGPADPRFAGPAGPAGPADSPSPARPARRRLVLALAAAAFLAFILTGTWARQLAWPGHQLAGDASFGGLRELASALAGHHLVLALALPLLIAIAAVGGAAILDDARAEEQE